MKKVKPQFVSWNSLKKELAADPKVNAAYQQLQPEFEIARAILDARINRKISQAELAEKVGTGQAVISRLESGNSSPSLSLIKRVAEALGLRAQIRFIPKGQ